LNSTLLLCFFQLQPHLPLTTHYQIYATPAPALKVETAVFAEMLKNLQHSMRLVA
jgi:hypothetical protein